MPIREDQAEYLLIVIRNGSHERNAKARADGAQCIQFMFRIVAFDRDFQVNWPQTGITEPATILTCHNGAGFWSRPRIVHLWRPVPGNTNSVDRE